MTDTRTDVTPALSAEQWAWVAEDTAKGLGWKGVGETDERRVMFIALNNHALPDSHPGKLTRARVDALADIGHTSLCPAIHEGEAAECDYGCGYAVAQELRAALLALLPPAT